MPKVIVLFSLAIVASCALVEDIKKADTNVNLLSRDNFEKQIRDRGDVLYERDEGNDTFIVVKEKNRINKYHVYDHTQNLGVKYDNTATPVVATIDLTTRLCFVRANTEMVETNCENLRQDKDLAQFVP